MTTLAVRTVTSGIPLSHLAIGLSLMGFIFVLPALFDPKKFREAVLEFFGSNHVFMRIVALFHLLVAFLILNTRWTLNWNSKQSILVLVGYLILLRGVMWLWFPEFVSKMARRFLQKEWFVPAMSVVGLLVMAGIGYLGIWVY